MADTGRVVAGGVLIAAGLGGAGYALYRILEANKSAGHVGTGIQVSFSPGELSATGTQQTLAMTLAWQNPGDAETYAVQACILAGNGAVAGHFYVSAADAAKAESDYTAVSPAAAAQDAADPAMRVASASAAADGTGTVTLNAQVTPSEIQLPLRAVFWILPGGDTGSLVANDPTGSAPSATGGAVQGSASIAVA